MKAFVSYSFRDSELYIITLLFEQLRKSGYNVEASSNGNNPAYYSNLSIENSDVFIGIITNHSDSVDHVIAEWRIAKAKGIKDVLLIEEGVKVEDPSSISFIRFNRNSPNGAINKLFNINTAAAPQKKISSKSSGLEDVLVAGGIIVGLAALISLLSGENKK